MKLVKFLAFSLVLFLASCSKKEPAGCFTIIGTTKVNSEIQFDGNCSKDAESFEWNFGDGTSDIGATVKKKYTKVGAFTVILTVRNSGKSNEFQNVITVQ